MDFVAHFSELLMRVSVGASFMLANFLLCKNVNNLTGILSSLPYLLLGFSKIVLVAILLCLHKWALWHFPQQL